MTRIAALFAAAAVLVGLAVAGFFVMRDGNGDPFADCRTGQVAGGAATIGGPFTLVDGSGRSVTDAEAITGPTLVYFGYSFCPDVCPTDLSRNSLAAEEAAAKGVSVGQVFVTVDPARDTPEVMRTYAASIDPAILGLTGSAEQIDAAAKAFKVYYRRNGDDPDYYLMDHSSFTYLMAPGPEFLEFYPTSASAEDVADSVACYAERLKE